MLLEQRGELLQVGPLGGVGRAATPPPHGVRRCGHGRLSTSDSLLPADADASAAACAGLTATTTSPASEPVPGSWPGTDSTVTPLATTVGTDTAESSSGPVARTSTTSPGCTRAAAAAPSETRTG